MTQNLCPKCGCPPRFAIQIRKVKFALDADDQPVGSPRLCHRNDAPAGPATYECGAEHRWEEGQGLLQKQEKNGLEKEIAELSDQLDKLLIQEFIEPKLPDN